MENNIILYGASGHAKVIIDILNCNKIAIKKIIDDNPKTEEILGIEIFKNDNYQFDENDKVIISIGNNKVRKAISEKLNVNYFTAIHPSAIISDSATIGVGTVVMAGAIINSSVKIKNHCIINSGAIIEHDCVIENFAHISPGAVLAGNVLVGEGAQVGINSSIIQGVKIGKWSIIGAGTVVINDIPDNVTAVGNPARIIKNNF